MAVKDVCGRPRYVAFEIPPGERMDERELSGILYKLTGHLRYGAGSGQSREGAAKTGRVGGPKTNHPCESGRSDVKSGRAEEAIRPYPARRDHYAKLVRFDGRRGLVFFKHYDKEEIVGFIGRINRAAGRERIRILGISGIAKKATKKYLGKLGDTGAQKRE